MSNEAEYMNLDVENTTSKVETYIVDLFIKAADNRQIGIPNSWFWMWKTKSIMCNRKV